MAQIIYKPHCQEGIIDMNKVEFELNGDYIYKITLIEEMHIEANVFPIAKEEVVMDKKTFIEAFEKWVKNE